VNGFAVILARDGLPAPAEDVARVVAALAPFGEQVTVEALGSVTRITRGPSSVTRTGRTAPQDPSVLVGDIRLDGADALRASLGDASPPAGGSGDHVALVSAAWRRWGVGALERLRGDFSFARWDPAVRELSVVRDGLGGKPLYYADLPHRFVCSNALSAVLAASAGSAALDDASVMSFLVHGYTIDPVATIYATIRRVPPGHLLLTSDSREGVQLRRHWNFPVPEPLHLRGDDEYLERYREVLAECVRDRVGASRLALLLSGGLDSTSILATARRVDPRLSVHAYTFILGPRVPDDDELQFALPVARRYAEAHEVMLNRLESRVGDPLDQYRTPEPLDQPYWALTRELMRTVAVDSAVLFDGEDGDAPFIPPGVSQQMRRWPTWSVLARVARFVAAERRFPHMGTYLRRRFIERRPASAPTAAPSWVDAEFRSCVPLVEPTPVVAHPTHPESHEAMSSVLWEAIVASNSPEYTGVAVDIRYPMRDTRLMEFAWSIPPIPYCQRKEIVRRAFVGELPDAVLRRPKRTFRGFDEITVGTWRAQILGQRAPLGDAVRRYVNADAVESVLRQGAPSEVIVAWRALELDRWLRQR
jgi:asparagine synthase (glutamine-hydrolysing)